MDARQSLRTLLRRPGPCRFLASALDSFSVTPSIAALDHQSVHMKAAEAQELDDARVMLPYPPPLIVE